MRRRRRHWTFAVPLCFFLAALAARRLVPSLKPQRASPPPAAPGALDPDEDGLPGKDEPFTRLELISEPDWRTDLTAHYVNEEVKAYHARQEGGVVLIEQPDKVPADWDYDLHGLVLGKTRLAGDLDADIVLDLERSALSPRTGDPDRYSCLVFQPVFAGEGNLAAWVAFAPKRKAKPRPSLWNGSDQPTVDLPQPFKRLNLHMERRGSQVKVTASTERGPLGQVLELDSPSAKRPLRQLELYAQALRPEGAEKSAVWKVPGKDVYAIRSFRVSCVDPQGCTVRRR